jgi:hypothetical protein
MQDSTKIKLEAVLKKYGLEAVDTIKKVLIANDKGDSNFIKSLSYNFKIDVDEIVLNINLNDYWVFIQLGRKPNSKIPPKQPILNWMKRKGIDEKYEFPIRRKIGLFGIKPINIVGFLINDNTKFKDNLLKDIRNVLGYEMKATISDAIKDFNEKKMSSL